MKFVDRVRAAVQADGLHLATSDLTVVCAGTTTALRDVSVDIPPNSFVGIEGLNGSGKSTLANVLLGLAGRSFSITGMVSYSGHDIYASSVGDRDRTRLRSTLFSYVPKVASLESALTVRQNILRPYRLTGRHIDGVRLRDLTDAFEITDLMDAPTRSLSSGYQQRANIVRGLLADVPAVVLDEPTDALDPAQKDAVLELLGRHAQGRTVVVVSHERTGATDRIRLHGGSIA